MAANVETLPVTPFTFVDLASLSVPGRNDVEGGRRTRGQRATIESRRTKGQFSGVSLSEDTA